MVEPVTDVEALIAWHEEAARRWDGPGLGQTGDYHAKAATALRTLQERVAELEAGVAQLSDQNDKLQDLIPSLPDGWVAVPEEPTREMEDAGRYRDAEKGESIYAGIYRAMLSARPAPPTEPPRGWQPIETAPRDRPILIVASAPMFSERRVYMAWWATPYEAAPDDLCFWRAYSALGNAVTTIPPEWATLWQPVPAPPKPLETER